MTALEKAEALINAMLPSKSSISGFTIILRHSFLYNQNMKNLPLSLIISVFIGLYANGQNIDTLITMDSNGNPIRMDFMGDGKRSNYVLNYEYDSENRITKEFSTDTLGEILPRIGLSEVITYGYEKEGDSAVEVTAYFDKDMKPSVHDMYGYHKVRTKYNLQNQIVEEWYFYGDGKTFERISFKYNSFGLLSEINYLDESGALTEDGVAVVRIEYDEEGRIIKETNFDSKINPYHTNRNPHLTVTKYYNGIECKRFYDNEMIELKPTNLSTCETIPNCQLPNIAKKPVEINEQNGKIKIIYFWASWSRPCIYNNKDLVKLAKKLKANEVEIISIALEKPGEQAKWEAAIRESNLNWEKHLSDFKHWDSQGAKIFGVESIPIHFILDEHGVLIGNNLRTVAEVEDILIQKGKL